MPLKLKEIYQINKIGLNIQLVGGRPVGSLQAYQGVEQLSGQSRTRTRDLQSPSPRPNYLTMLTPCTFPILQEERNKNLNCLKQGLELFIHSIKSFYGTSLQMGLHLTEKSYTCRFAHLALLSTVNVNGLPQMNIPLLRMDI